MPLLYATSLAFSAEPPPQPHRKLDSSCFLRGSTEEAQEFCYIASNTASSVVLFYVAVPQKATYDVTACGGERAPT